VGSFRTIVGIALVAVFVTGPAGHARDIRGPTGQLELKRKIFLSCFIQNHMLNVGNQFSSVIRMGTRIWFVAKLENAGYYARTIILPGDIPPHLSVNLSLFFSGVFPLFDNNSQCQAWWVRPPVVAPGR
jgi:hypothetical protein